MYTILVDNSNQLITSVKERIIQRSKLVDKLHFLVSPTYKEYDMTKFSATMEFVLPVSKELHTETLPRSEELYKDMLEYTLPFDTMLTKEGGDVEVKLTFVYLEMTPGGQVIQHVRKTDKTKITIVEVPAWCQIIPDEALAALDQEIIKMDARINALNDMSELLSETKADNVTYNSTTHKLQLTANGEPIGDAVTIQTGGGGVGISDVQITVDGELIVFFDNGTIKNLGKVVGDDGVVYIPSINSQKILSWTIDTEPGPVPAPVDLNPSDEWEPVGTDGETEYIWEEI